MVSKEFTLLRLTLDTTSESSDYESLDYEIEEQEEEELPAESNNAEGEEVSSSESVPVEGIPASSMEIPVYDDTALLEAISTIDARLQEVNSNLAINQEQNAYSISMYMWTLVVAAGLLITYLFYSIAKKFI